MNQNLSGYPLAQLVLSFFSEKEPMHDSISIASKLIGGRTRHLSSYSTAAKRELQFLYDLGYVSFNSQGLYEAND